MADDKRSPWASPRAYMIRFNSKQWKDLLAMDMERMRQIYGDFVATKKDEA